METHENRFDAFVAKLRTNPDQVRKLQPATLAKLNARLSARGLTPVRATDPEGLSSQGTTPAPAAEVTLEGLQRLQSDFNSRMGEFVADPKKFTPEAHQEIYKLNVLINIARQMLRAQGVAV